MIGRADLVVVDDIDNAKIEAGELMRAAEPGLFSWDSAVALHDVIGGARAGRATPEQIVLAELQGIGIEDVAIARARLPPGQCERGVGLELAGMTVYDPPAAPRQRDAGYKGDGWTVTLPPPGGDEAVLGLDTGSTASRSCVSQMGNGIGRPAACGFTLTPTTTRRWLSRRGQGRCTTEPMSRRSRPRGLPGRSCWSFRRGSFTTS